MKTNITKELPQSREEWLKLRQKSIGGSDAATVVGLNSYSSPYALWLEKTGHLKEQKDNEAMRQGRDLESYVKERFTEATGKIVEEEPCIIRNSNYPWAHATIDGKIKGENAGLECKTVNANNWNKYKEDGFPYYYYVQCLHYMAVCGYDKYYLAVLVFGQDFKWFEFERDKETEEAIENLMHSEENFWKLVEDKTPPEMDGSQATDEALAYEFVDPREDRVNLFDMNGKAERLVKLRDKKKETEKEIKILEQEFKSKIGNSLYGDTYGFEFSWKPQKRKVFQKDKLIKDHPEIDFEPYYKETESRVFRVKELENE